MKLYLCGIKSYQLDLGLKCTAFGDLRLEQTLAGIKRDYNEPQQRQRTPLTQPYLLRILDAIDNTSYNSIMTCAAFTLAFASFLRVGEFTYRRIDLDLGATFRNWFLTQSSISQSDDGTHMTRTLHASKTDPFRHGIQLVIPSSTDSGYPVAAMRQLIRIDSPRAPFAPLFCLGKQDILPFTREYVVQKLQSLVVRCGLGGEAWNGHSFRRGAATWVA